MDTLTGDDPRAVELIGAIRRGDVPLLQRLLVDHHSLATAWIVGTDGMRRTPLHVAIDWPKYFPNGPDVVALLLAAGADPNAPAIGAAGGHAQTPLHWAASSGDVDVAAVLIDGGADLEARRLHRRTRPAG